MIELWSSLVMQQTASGQKSERVGKQRQAEARQAGRSKKEQRVVNGSGSVVRQK